MNLKNTISDNSINKLNQEDIYNKWEDDDEGMEIIKRHNSLVKSYEYTNKFYDTLYKYSLKSIFPIFDKLTFNSLYSFLFPADYNEYMTNNFEEEKEDLQVESNLPISNEDKNIDESKNNNIYSITNPWNKV